MKYISALHKRPEYLKYPEEEVAIKGQIEVEMKRLSLAPGKSFLKDAKFLK